MVSNNIDNFVVYILRTSRNTLYTGQTNNLERRIKEHNDKKGKGAKYTRCFEECVLVHHEFFATRNEAMKREAEIKKLTKKQKEALIAKDGIGK